ncbi:MAG: hypothetical protein ABI691_19885 [Ginsengibacter sp.]
MPASIVIPLFILLKIMSLPTVRLGANCWKGFAGGKKVIPYLKNHVLLLIRGSLFPIYNRCSKFTEVQVVPNDSAMPAFKPSWLMLAIL